MRRWILSLAAAAVVLAGAGRLWAEAAPAPTDADAAHMAYLKEIRLIEIRHLRSKDAAEFEKGRLKLQAIRDEAAIGPMVSVLYGTNARYRGILIELLSEFAQRKSAVAQAYLQEVAVGDGSSSHRRRAVEGLKHWSGDRPTDRLMAHLALDEVPEIRGRAATALATLEERKAVWLLVEKLVTEDVRMVGGEQWNSSMQIDVRAQMAGVPRFRQSVVQAAVPGLGIATATIDLPEVNIVDIATTIAMTERGKVTPHFERIQTQHPEVLAALKALTGKDFGYSQAAWQKWLQSEEAAKVVPPWQPVTIKSE